MCCRVPDNPVSLEPSPRIYVRCASLVRRHRIDLAGAINGLANGAFGSGLPRRAERRDLRPSQPFEIVRDLAMLRPQERRLFGEPRRDLALVVELGILDATTTARLGVLQRGRYGGERRHGSVARSRVGFGQGLHHGKAFRLPSLPYRQVDLLPSEGGE